MIDTVTGKDLDKLELAIMAKQSLVVKMVMIYLNSISAFNAQTDLEFAKYVKEFSDSTLLEDKTAKVPFFSGTHFNYITPADSGRYRTLWPIYPAPLFFNCHEYSQIVSMGGGVPNQLPYITFKHPDAKPACNLMKELLKHLYGWLS